MFGEIEDKWESVLEEELKEEMEKAPSPVVSHDMNHIYRVWKNAKEIAEKIPCDMEILIAAVFLHDIGRHYPEGVSRHGPISAPYAESVLKRIRFPSEKIEPAIMAVKYHDETFPSEKRPAIEAKILYDADKLDALGAIGITRYITLFTAKGWDLLKIADFAIGNLPHRYETMELSDAKEIAKARFEYALDYFRKLKEELSR